MELEELGKIKDNNYYQISGWMINRLGLKGAGLNVYAIIYGFSQDGESEFTGSRQYLADFINATKPTVDKALNELCEKEYILKTQKVINNVTFNTYKVNMQAVKILCGGSKETLPPDKENLQGGSKETLQGGSKETLHNNKSLNNKSLNNKKNKEEERKKEVAPSSSYENIINEFIFEEEVKAIIYEFIKMRKLIKKPLTDFALKRLLQRLQTISGDPQEQVAILEKSINNNWLGIFPLKDEENAPRAYQQQGGNVFLDMAHEEGIF